MGSRDLGLVTIYFSTLAHIARFASDPSPPSPSLVRFASSRRSLREQTIAPHRDSNPGRSLHVFYSPPRRDCNCLYYAARGPWLVLLRRFAAPTDSNFPAYDVVVVVHQHCYRPAGLSLQLNSVFVTRISVLNPTEL